MADFVIVGGGVYGCGVAWALAQQGAEVVLLEADTIAAGASGGLGKRGVRANGRDVRELPLMKMAYEIWPILHEILGADVGYERQGHLLLYERPQEFVSAEAQLWMQNQQGIPTHLVKRDELHNIEPHLSPHIFAALHCPKDGIADHTATTKAYAQAAVKLGAEIREGVAVTALERDGERVTAVQTNTGARIPIGKQLLLMCNTAVPGLVQQQLGLTLPIWKMLPQVMLTEKVEPMPLRHLIGHAHRVLAMKSHPTGQIMISGGWRGRWNEQGQPETQPDQVAGNFAEAVATYPLLAHTAVAEADATRPETICIDHIPIIGRLPAVDNLLVATGWSGHGWAIAPAVTQLLADWALSGEEPPLLRPFGYKRF